jgi:hypothetical protein
VDFINTISQVIQGLYLLLLPSHSTVLWPGRWLQTARDSVPVGRAISGQNLWTIQHKMILTAQNSSPVASDGVIPNFFPRSLHSTNNGHYGLFQVRIPVSLASPNVALYFGLFMFAGSSFAPEGIVPNLPLSQLTILTFFLCVHSRMTHILLSSRYSDPSIGFPQASHFSLSWTRLLKNPGFVVIGHCSTTTAATIFSASQVRLNLYGTLYFLCHYCAISFNSARAVTRDPKYRFGTSATNKVWRDTSKNLAFNTEIFENSAFFAPLREIWP